MWYDQKTVIKSKIAWKTKINFLLSKKNFSFWSKYILWKVFFKVLNNLSAPAFFCWNRLVCLDIDMPQEKPQHLTIAKENFKCCFVILQKPHVEPKSGFSVLTHNVLNQSDCRILWSSISLEGIINNSIFLHVGDHQRKAASQTTTFGWAWPITLQVSLIISIWKNGKNQLTCFCAYS